MKPTVLAGYILSLATIVVGQSEMMDLLVPISNDPPPSIFPKITHPFSPQFADPNVESVVPTNAWISNLFYSSTDNIAPTTLDPYTFRVLDDYNGNRGLSIRQPSTKKYGPYPQMNDVPATEAGYMINSVAVDLRFTCSEWGSQKPKLSVTSWDHFSANLELSSSPDKRIDFPLVRGMAYVTGIYHNLTPQFFSQHAFIDIVADSSNGDVYTGHKFKVSMNDQPQTVFLIYALGNQPLSLRKDGNSNLVSTGVYNGPIRVAKLPKRDDEQVLDKYSKRWPMSAIIQAEADGAQGTYTIDWYAEGKGDLLMYAYPHHLATLQNAKRTGLVLPSATKGDMEAVVGNRWVLHEPELSNVTWLSPQPGAAPSAVHEIMDAMDEDLNSDYHAQTFLHDNYFSGKGLQKFALLALILNKPDETHLRNPEMAVQSLEKLKTALLPFIENRQPDPFRYDNLYKGVVVREGLPESMGGTGNVEAAFGHSYYNDHHYHHGYLIVTAAIVRYLDPTWKTEELFQWTQSLIRDVNTPVDDDPYYAPFRNWDWFAGHSWAGGIKIHGALDGLDQESVPESVNFYWGVKLWGLATGNQAMSNLAALQLAITKRTTYEYFWMLDDNKNRPQSMIANKVVGIYFEQKTDYTTYFGRYLEFIHGIQQLPMTPALADDIRTREFVLQEWQQKLADVAPTIQNPWASVLYLNYAIADPGAAFRKLRKVQMDDGMTRAYSLYLASTRPEFYRGLRVVKNHPGFNTADNTVRPQQHHRLSRTFINTVRRLNLTSQHDDRYNGY